MDGGWVVDGEGVVVVVGMAIGRGAKREGFGVVGEL